MHIKPAILVVILLIGSITASYSQNASSEELMAIIKQKNSNDTSRALAMAELAFQYWDLKSDSAELLASQTVNLADKIHFTKGLARGYCVLGIYYNHLGNSTRALSCYDTALTFANSISDGLAIGRIYNGLGQIFANFGDYEKALNYHFQSLRIKETQNDSIGIGNSYNNIGNIYFRLGNNEKALSYCLRSLGLRKRHNDEQGIAASQNNIALIYDKLGNPTSSLNSFFEALNSFKKAGNQRGITYACHDMAQLFIGQEKYDSAFKYLQDGLNTAYLMKSNERVADFKVSFAKYYNATGKFDEVQKNAKEALRIAEESHLLDYARSAYKELAIASNRTGNFKQAYLYQLEFIFLTDSIQNEMKIEKALQEEFNFRESKSRLEQEKKDLVYQNAASKQRWLLYGTVSALVAFMTVAFTLYRSSKMKKKSSDLLAIQKNELQEAKDQLEQKIEERTQDLKLSNEELVNQNLVMEQFSFMTAHNLRGPVARLKGLCALFNFSDPGDPFNLELIKRMERSSNDLDEVIHDITAILRVKSGVQDPVVSLNLKETLDKVLYQFREALSEKYITIQIDLDPQSDIRGTLAYVQSIFYNVISNSIKYADNSRPPEIIISSIQTDKSITITIKDNGIGFEAEQHREKLFRPFTRFTTAREGKGLGLYLIKIQMESMKGDVQIKSKSNSGTSVVLTFPL